MNTLNGDTVNGWRSRVVRSVVALALLVVGLPLVTVISGGDGVKADPAANPPNVSQATTGALAGGNVPDGTCRAHITATGGGGGSAGLANPNGGLGGGGAIVNATVTVLPGQSYSGSVAGGGQATSAGGVGGGGTGGTITQQHRGAGGGGRTVVALGGLTQVVAGGGGGGGAAHQTGTPLPGNGGAAGTAVGAGTAGVGVTGSNGVDNPVGNTVGGGQGGQAAAGGAGGVNSGSAARNGAAGGGTATGTGGNGGPDANYDSGGGGGAGYTGGGGGASTVGDTVTGAGGGGGSSWAVGTSPVVSATVPTSITGASAAQTLQAANGANGSVTIDWIPCQYDLVMTKTVSPSPINAGDRATWTVSITNSGPDPMTRGDTISLVDTLPTGPDATTPGPAFRVASIATSGGSNTNMLNGAVTCTGVVVGSTMPAATVCSRPYGPAAGTPGAPPATSGTRGLNVGETLTIVYEQVISNTAPCATITNTATITDRPTVSGTTDVVGVPTVNNVARPLVINCYDLAVVKTVGPTPDVALGGTITWTVTVTNNGPGSMNGPVATVANPLVVSDVFPSTGVGSASLTSASGPAGACSLVASTVTCATGLPASGVEVLTFTQTVSAGAADGTVVSNTATVSDPRTGDANDSSTASTTILHPRLTLNKTIASRANAADQFTVRIVNGVTTVATATTAGAGLNATTGVVLAAGGTYTLSEVMAAGSVSNIAQYTNFISCTNTNASSTTVLPSGAGTSFTVAPTGLDNITCTFTNTPRPALVTMSKTTTGGVGTFDFGLTNLSSATTAVTTTIVGTPALSSQYSATTVGSAVTIAETVPAGWQFNTATCTDSNNAVTGNPASFGTLAGSTLTIPAANVRAGSVITCAFTNTKLARLTITKTGVGGGGAFTYTTTGGLAPSPFTLNPAPPVSDSRTFVDLAAGTYTVTEAALAGFQLADITCANLAGGSAGSTNSTNIGTGLLSVTLVAGADYQCTYTNIKNANVSVIKNTVGGDGTFTYVTSGTGNVPDPTPSITTVAGTGSSAFNVPFTSIILSRSVVITENAPPAGWVLTAIACTDSLGAPVGTPNLGTRSVTFTATPGALISCRFTNEMLPTVVIRKQSIGGTGTFNFGGGTNGLPAALALNTGAGNPANSTAYMLSALNTSTSITETIPANYTLTSVVCVDESSTPVSTSLVGGTLTINAGALSGGVDLICTFTNTRKSAQVSLVKTWVNGQVGNQVTLGSAGGTNNPSLVAVANTTNETDTGTAVTVYAGETLTLSETFNIGSAANYSTGLVCTGATDGNPSDGLAIVAADNGATIVCTYTNTGLPNVFATKTAGSVTGPNAAGTYQVTYAVTVTDSGIAPSTYGPLVDTPTFAANLTVTGAAWTTSGAGAPAGGSASGAGPFTLAPAGSAIDSGVTHTYNVTVSFTFATYTAASACAGSGTGLFNSIGLASGDTTPNDNTACVPPPPPPTPSINVVKSALPTTVTAAGQGVAYSFLVTNTGNVTLTSVGVTDPLPGLSAVSCPVSTLAPAAVTTCTANYTVTQANMNAGSIVNTATATGTPPAGSPVTDTDSATVTATQSPSIIVAKSALPGTVNAAGQIINYSFLVTNTGNVTLTSVGVTDPLPGLSAVSCPASTLAPSATTMCTASYTVTQADVNAGSITNTATTTGTPPVGPPVTDTDSTIVTATQSPSITVVKSALPTSVNAAGQVITYSFLVTNTGNVTLTSVGVTDPLPGLSVVSCPVSTLAPSISTTCTATYTAAQSDIDAGSIINTATTTGTPPSGSPVTDTDTLTVSATPDSSITIVKSALPTTVTAAGDVVAYSFVVTNTGDVTLTSVGVTDPLPGLSAVSCPVSTLAPSASTTCTGSYAVTQAAMDAGSIVNTATASGTPPYAPIVTDTDSVTVTATQSPSITVVKSALPTTVTAASQIVAYSFVVTNTGNVTLTSVGVSDPLPGLSVVSCPVSTLAPSGSTTCTASYAVTQVAMDAGSIVNTATASGTPPVGPAVTDTDSVTVTATQSPSINVAKSALPTTVTAAGDVVAYSFLVTNTGNVTLTSVGVTDPLPGLSVISCPDSTLAPSVSTTCTASYTVTLSDMNAGSIVNTATTTGSPPTGPAVTDTDSATVTSNQSPSITVVKSALPATVTAAGDVVAYSLLVTNTGNVTLTSVGVTDPLPGLSVVSCPVSTLAPSGSTTCTASYTVTLANMDAGSIVNTATASGTPPSGPAVTDTDSTTVTATQSPSIAVVKSALPATVTAAGDVVAYSFVVTNTGNVTLTWVGVADPLPGLSVVSCPVSTLAPSVATTCTASYTVTLADMDAGSIVNTATASGTPPVGPVVSDSDWETVTATQLPSISVVKSALPTTVTAAGQTVAYSFEVTNTGNVTLTSVGVTDPLPGLSVVSCPASTLAPSVSTTCTASYTVTVANMDAGSIVNTATASGTPPTGPAVTDTDSVTVTATQSPSITVVKSALPSTVTAAGEVVAYSFVVTNTGNVTLTSVGVTDPLPGLSAVSCPVSTLAPSDSTTCTASYTITLADMDTGSVLNTATTTGTPPVGPAVTDTDSATVTATQSPSITIVKSALSPSVTAAGQSVGYTFVVTNTGNVTLTTVGVSDPLPGLSVVSCPVSTLAPSVSTTCTASYTVTQSDMDAGSIVNTATATGTPPVGPAVTDTDSATVTATQLPSITIVKSALPTTVTAAGQSVAYSFLVTNGGNVTLTSVGVTDPLPGLSAVSCPASTLAPSAATTCTASYTVTQSDMDAGSILNTATASGTPPVGAAVTDSDWEAVTATQSPSITIDKWALPTTVTAAGDGVAYSFLVTNSGNVTLAAVGVTDPLPGLSVVSCLASTLAPSVSTTCTASYTTTQADVDAGSISNTATASGTPPSGPDVTDTDTATVTATQSPSISIVKSALPTTVTAAGDPVAYSFLVTNSGNVTLTAVGVTDPLPDLSVVSCPASTLAPSVSTTCTASYTVTQADVDTGSILNTATASGTPPSGPDVIDIDSATVTATQLPSISIVKSALPTSVTAAGEVVGYSFLVTNGGNVTLTSVDVTDPLPGLSAVSCPVSTLAPSDSTTCTASYTVTQADMDAGSIVNTATTTGTPPNGPAVTDADSATVTATQSPSITIAKSALPTTVTAAGDGVAYSFLVTNTGNVTLTAVGVTDPLPGLSVVSCTDSTLAPSGSTTCTASYTATQADIDAGSILNTATATGTPPSGPDVTDSDSETVTATQSPSITIVKSAVPTTVTAAGDGVAYSFVVTNTGNVTLTAVDVTDPLPGLSAVSCPVSTLAPSDSTTCTASYTATQADIDAGSILNTATATGTPPSGPDITDSDSETVTATQSPSIMIVKSAVPTTVTDAGDSVAYSFLVTNTGNVTLTAVDVTDPLPGLSVVSCPLSTLAPSVSTTCTANYTVTQSDVDAGSIVNLATATGAPPSGPDVTDTDSATVAATSLPEISIVKSALPTTVTAAGQSVVYSFLVTNTGNVTLSAVGVTDPLPGLSVVSCPASTLAPFASTTCTASYIVTLANMNAGSIVNTATASGTPPTGPAVTDSDSETVTATQSPSITIVKSAVPTTVTAAGDGVAYSFLVTNTGNVTLTAVGVTDPLPGLSAVSCPVSTLAPSISTTCTASYTVSLPNMNAGSIVNTATASGTPPTGPTVTDTDSATVTATQSPSITVAKSALPTTVTAAGQSVAYSFLVTNTGNVTLTSVVVTDPLPGLSVVNCPASTLAPSASTTCSASRTVTQADVNAGSIVNTATASGTPPSGPAVTDTDSATVTATQSPSINVVKSALPTTVIDAGDAVAYSFLVTNSGNVTLTLVGVTDPLPGLSAVSCPASTLAPSASTTCTASYTVTQADIDTGSILNTATASGTPPSGPAVTDDDSATVTANQLPSLTIVKSALPTTVSAPGQTVAYSFFVVNDGNVTLTSVGVTDPLPGLSVVSCPVSTLAPSASTTCTASYTVTQANIDAGSILNTATASGTPPSGPVVTATDSATVTATQSPSITVAKSALPTFVTAAGQGVAYSFLVTNTGNVTLMSVGVSDPLPGLSAVNCPSSTLAPSVSMTCTASYSVTQADMDAGAPIANTASVSGTPPSGPPVTDFDSATVTTTQSPSIDVAKSASPTIVTAVGQTVAYSFLVTNTGNVTLTSVDVTDPLPGLSAVSCPASTLGPSASTTCTASYTVTAADISQGSIVNTATATGTPPSGPAVTDTDSATVSAPNGPGAAIVKSTSATSYSAVGQVLNFTLTATNNGNVTLTNVIVSDAFAVVGTCSPAAPATLLPGESITCPASHSTTQADLNLGHFDNVGEVSGTTPSSATVDYYSNLVTVPAIQTPAVTISKSTTASGFTTVGQQIPYTITATNTGNIDLTNVVVTDPNAVMGTCTPATPATLAPGQSITCSAVHSVTANDVTAKSISNTALVAAKSGVLNVSGTSNIVVVSRSASGGIPLTGADIAVALRVIGFLMMAGLLLLFVAKRRRQLDQEMGAM